MINRPRFDGDAIKYRVRKLIIEYEVVQKLNIKLYRGDRDYGRPFAVVDGPQDQSDSPIHFSPWWFPLSVD